MATSSKASDVICGWWPDYFTVPLACSLHGLRSNNCLQPLIGIIRSDTRLQSSKLKHHVAFPDASLVQTEVTTIRTIGIVQDRGHTVVECASFVCFAKHHTGTNGTIAHVAVNTPLRILATVPSKHTSSIVSQELDTLLQAGQLFPGPSRLENFIKGNPTGWTSGGIQFPTCRSTRISRRL